MKAILLIDMPDSCEECDYCGWSSDEMYRACLLNNCHLFHSEFVEIGRDGCCPLKPLPQKKQHGEEIDYEYGYIDGWNDCLKEVTGE